MIRLKLGPTLRVDGKRPPVKGSWRSHLEVGRGVREPLEALLGPWCGEGQDGWGRLRAGPCGTSMPVSLRL